PPDEPHIMSRHLSREYLETSPYFQQVLKPGGIVDIMQYFLIVEPTRMGGLGFGRNEAQGIVTDRELELGALLLPHVQRAMRIGNLLDLRAIECSRLTEALDGLRCGVILTSERGGILHANKSAEVMLRHGELVRSTAGMLRLAT